MEAMVQETVCEKTQTVNITLSIKVEKERTRYGTCEMIQHWLETNPYIQVTEIKVTYETNN